MLNLLKHEIQSRWGAILGWGIGLSLFGSMYIGIWPEMGDQLGDLTDLSIYEGMGIDMGSFAGYIASVVVQYIPLLLSIYAITASTGTLAGEEDKGTLELLMSTPLKRWEIVSVKAVAIAVVVLLIVILAGIGDAIVLALIRTSVEVDVTPMQLFTTILNSWPIMMAVLMMGLFFGAYLPNRRTAIIAVTTIFVASFFLKVTAGLVEALDFVRYISLFNYFDTTAEVFSEGVKATDVAILLTVAVVFFVLALLSFQRRNVTVGAWFWQKAQVNA